MEIRVRAILEMMVRAWRHKNAEGGNPLDTNVLIVDDRNEHTLPVTMENLASQAIEMNNHT
jgi:hypothetical protein